MEKPSELAQLLGIKPIVRNRKFDPLKPPTCRRHDADLGEGLGRPNGGTSYDQMARILAHIADLKGYATRISMKNELNVTAMSITCGLEWLMETGLVTHYQGTDGQWRYRTKADWFDPDPPMLANCPVIMQTVIKSTRLILKI